MVGRATTVSGDTVASGVFAHSGGMNAGTMGTALGVNVSVAVAVAVGMAVAVGGTILCVT